MPSAGAGGLKPKKRSRPKDASKPIRKGPKPDAPAPSKDGKKQITLSKYFGCSDPIVQSTQSTPNKQKARKRKIPEPEIEGQDDMAEISREELAELAKSKSKEYVVYILRSVPRPMRTYAGMTNKILHRIRQHNGELAGGARATKTTRPWELYAIVYGFGSDKCRTLRCEWFTKVKHYKCSGGVPGSNGVERRRFLIKHAMSKCRSGGPKLCARMLALEDKAVSDNEPIVQKLSLPSKSEMVIVVSPPIEPLAVIEPADEIVPEEAEKEVEVEKTLQDAESQK